MNTCLSLIIGFLFAVMGILLYNGVLYFDIYIIFVFLFIGGFIATYLSYEKKSMTGLYVGVIISLLIFTNIAYYGNRTANEYFFTLMGLMIFCLPVGLIGGLIAKYLSKRK
jgi:hypothetical protein